MTESARWATRQAVVENVLGDETIDSLSMSIVGMLEAERDLTYNIGRVFVDGDNAAANDCRDRLYRAQTVREVAERFLAEARSIQEERP